MRGITLQSLAPRWFIATTLVFASFLSLPATPAHAAADVTAAVYPKQPIAGEPAALIFQTWWAFPDTVTPADMADYPFDIRLRAQGGQSSKTSASSDRIAPQQIDAVTWYAPVTFPKPGDWEIDFTNWQDGSRNLHVTVLPADGVGEIAPTESQVTPEHRINGCPVSLLSPDGPPDTHARRFTQAWYGSDGLWAGLSPDMMGRLFASREGMKVLWYREREGMLSITGTRLDAPAEPLAALIPEGYGARGYQATGLMFPTGGCWMVLGRAGDQELRFIVSLSSPDKRSAEVAPSATPTSETWSSIRRPLQGDVINPPTACTASRDALVGPVYPAGAARDGVLHGRAGKGWWAVDPSYQGPVLIRGGGSGDLRFPYDGTSDELHLWGPGHGKDPTIPNPDGSNDPAWRYWSLATTIPGSSCHAIQIDGWNFSYVILMPAQI